MNGEKSMAFSVVLGVAGAFGVGYLLGKVREQSATAIADAIALKRRAAFLDQYKESAEAKKDGAAVYNDAVDAEAKMSKAVVEKLEENYAKLPFSRKLLIPPPRDVVHSHAATILAATNEATLIAQTLIPLSAALPAAQKVSASGDPVLAAFAKLGL